jgi:hypothetical protein
LILCPTEGTGELATNSASDTELPVLSIGEEKAGSTSLRIGLEGGFDSSLLELAACNMRKYSGLMKGEARGGERRGDVDRSGEDDRKGRWHAGQSEKEWFELAPLRTSC